MLDKILSVVSWFTSSSSAWLYVVCVMIGAFGGWYLTSDHYAAKIESIRTELLAQSKKEIDDYASRLAKVADDLVVANRRLSDLSSRNGDLTRRLQQSANREADRSKAYSEATLRTKYSECKRLLGEGNDILVEGSELVGKVAAEKDALVKLVK